jgi:hypothetical protein
LDDLIVGASDADPSDKSDAGKSYVVFGKANGSAINLSAIADASNPTGGFVINGEAAGDQNGLSVSSAGDVNQHKIYLLLICHLDQHHMHSQSNHPSRRR